MKGNQQALLNDISLYFKEEIFQQDKREYVLLMIFFIAPKYAGSVSVPSVMIRGYSGWIFFGLSRLAFIQLLSRSLFLDGFGLIQIHLPAYWRGMDLLRSDLPDTAYHKRQCS